MLLKLANKVLILINTGPSNVNKFYLGVVILHLTFHSPFNIIVWGHPAWCYGDLLPLTVQHFSLVFPKMSSHLVGVPCRYSEAPTPPLHWTATPLPPYDLLLMHLQPFLKVLDGGKMLGQCMINFLHQSPTHLFIGALLCT